MKLIDSIENFISIRKLDENINWHYGFWKPNENRFDNALIYQNYLCSKILSIKPNETVLDLGCGIGGSSKFLIDNFNCKVFGVDLNHKSLLKSRKLIKNSNNYYPIQMNMDKLLFKEEKFNIIWMLESICHSKDQESLLNVLYKLLKNKGKIIFTIPYINNKKNESMKLVKNIERAWKISLKSKNFYLRTLEKWDYKNIRFFNYTNSVIKSSKLFYYTYLIDFLIFKILPISNQKIQNINACHFQYNAFKNKILNYGIFIAEK